MTKPKTCGFSTKRSRSSPMGGIQDVPVGTVSECPHEAKHRCPACSIYLCSNHARSLTTMGGKLSNSGKRKCSACKHVAGDVAFAMRLDDV
jgi:hypothetical protein